MRIRSPSRANAIGPPSTASGATWPTQNPHVPPENRPSVTSAQSAPRPAPFERAGHGEHLAHPRTAFRALVSDHEHRARHDIAGQDRRHRPFLPVEDSRRPLERELVPRQSGHLDDRSLRRQRAGEDVDAALGMDRSLERVDDDPIGRGRRDLGQVLRHRPSGDGDRVAVQQSGVEEQLQHDGHAADAVEVDHVELAAGSHVSDVRDPGRDLVEVVELERHTGLVGDGQEVEDGVRRAAERRRHARSRSRTPAW